MPGPVARPHSHTTRDPALPCSRWLPPGPPPAPAVLLTSAGLDPAHLGRAPPRRPAPAPSALTSRGPAAALRSALWAPRSAHSRFIHRSGPPPPRRPPGLTTAANGSAVRPGPGPELTAAGARVAAGGAAAGAGRGAIRARGGATGFRGARGDPAVSRPALPKGRRGLGPGADGRRRAVGGPVKVTAGSQDPPVRGPSGRSRTRLSTRESTPAPGRPWFLPAVFFHKTTLPLTLALTRRRGSRMHSRDVGPVKFLSVVSCCDLGHFAGPSGPQGPHLKFMWKEVYESHLWGVAQPKSLAWHV
ncbi:collagen alpha-1(II) chain-like [Sciurus carolinensis]|uniref:collagen alpha-1(II) chain-like n=1 Tax=Sciurus carolinensis TaxID=30640 RepID=UPI001FB46555|nr:collagen alpha-1(II) chain-like [Sciurus carolinensis]